MTEESSSHPYMLCVRTTQPPPMPAVVRNCFHCDGEVWVTLASLNLSIERNAKLICFPCLRYLHQPEQEIETESISESQLDELIDSLPSEHAQGAKEFFTGRSFSMDEVESAFNAGGGGDSSGGGASEEWNI